MTFLKEPIEPAHFFWNCNNEVNFFLECKFIYGLHKIDIVEKMIFRIVALQKCVEHEAFKGSISCKVFALMIYIHHKKFCMCLLQDFFNGCNRCCFHHF